MSLRTDSRVAPPRSLPRHRQAMATESGLLQPLSEQACPLAVVPDHLQEIPPASAKAEQMAAQRIALQNLLDLQSQGRESFSHVGVAGGQPYPNTARNRDHRRSRTSRTRPNASASTVRSTRTQRPSPRSISINPQAWREARGLASLLAATSPLTGRFVSASLIVTGTNPVPPRRPQDGPPGLAVAN